MGVGEARECPWGLDIWEVLLVEACLHEKVKFVTSLQKADLP